MYVKIFMRIHFIASTTNLATKISVYRRILRTVKDTKNSVVHEWIDEAERGFQNVYQAKSKAEYEALWKEIYKKNIEAISRADVIIAEVGAKSFFVGFQVARAIQLRKPTLILSQSDEVDSIIGLYKGEEGLRFEVYDSSSLRGIIENFLKEERNNLKDVRFNMFLSRINISYLNWLSDKTGLTKSELIRQLLDKDMKSSTFWTSSVDD